MITINRFDYESVVKKFSIYAAPKHGTRWLKSTNPDFEETLNPIMSGGKRTTINELLIKSLFIDEENPFGNSKIKLKKFKRTLRQPNVAFVYRDPYECFVSAIMTGAGLVNDNWEGDPTILDVIMTNNGHFSPTQWQEIYEILEPLEDRAVEFVELRELSKYFRINTLKDYPYDFDKYSFEKQLPNELKSNDIVSMCKTYHPQLWDNFMVQVEKETIALEKLKAKFSWKATNLF
jgi:hypothetical protein